MALQFQRNAKMYVEFTNSSTTGTATWFVPILAGFSFSQANGTSEITINEAGITSRRARLLFNDSLQPVEWSCSTYLRPTATTSPTGIVAPEQVLWAMLMGADQYNATTRQFSNTLITGPVSPSPAFSPSPIQAINDAATAANTFDFSGSNVSYFNSGNNMYFVFLDGSNEESFKLTDVVVNSVTVDFDVNGIATAQWSGFARTLAADATATWLATGSPNASVIQTGANSTTNFIRNRLSTVSLTNNADSDTYSIILTGGSFSVENNITYLIPEELGKVNQPIGNVTGARSISGTMTCYLDNDTANSKSLELWQDLIAATTVVRNSHALTINVGGATSGNPRVALSMPTAHLEIPSIGVDDLLTLDVNFHGQVASGNADNTDEATIIYRA